VAHALDCLWASIPAEDRTILFPLGSFLAEHAADLALLRARDSSGGQPPAGSRKTHPVSTALLLFRPDVQFPGLNRLLLILASAAIEAGAPAPKEQLSRIGKLAAIVRGSLEDRDSPLRLILKDASSLPRMMLSIDRQLQDGNAQLHQTFAAAWRQWLRGTLSRWIQTDPAQLSAALRPHALVPDIEDADLDLGGGKDVDDQSTVHCDLTEPSSPSEPDIPGPIGKRRAIAKGLTRASGGDLHSPADQIAPTELVAALAKSAMQVAKTAFVAVPKTSMHENGSVPTAQHDTRSARPLLTSSTTAFLQGQPSSDSISDGTERTRSSAYPTTDTD